MTVYTLLLRYEGQAAVLVQREPTEDPTVDFLLSHTVDRFQARPGRAERVMRPAGRTIERSVRDSREGILYEEFLALDGSAGARVRVNDRPAELGYRGRERLDVAILDGPHFHGLLHRQVVAFQSVHQQVRETGSARGARMVSSYRYTMEWDGDPYLLTLAPASRRAELGVTHVLDLARGHC